MDHILKDSIVKIPDRDVLNLMRTCSRINQAVRDACNNAIQTIFDQLTKDS